MKKLNILLFAALLISLTSCLKDGPVNLAPGASPPVIQWSTATIDDAPKNSNTSSFRLYSRIYPIGTSISMTVQVDITGTDPAPSDITVGIGTSTTAYNTFVGASTTNPQLPAAAFTMPSSVVIPKGTRVGWITITLNTTLLDATKTYYLPLTITSTTFGGISGNYGTVIYSVAPANKFDGLYTYNNAATSNILPGLTVSGAPLITSGANGVATTLFQDPSWGSQAIYTFSTTLVTLPTGVTYYPITGISCPNFFPIALADVDLTVSGYYPATKVIRAKYKAGIYNLDETYTYTGSRISTK